jgi:hypothetical protein
MSRRNLVERNHKVHTESLGAQVAGGPHGGAGGLTANRRMHTRYAPMRGTSPYLFEMDFGHSRRVSCARRYRARGEECAWR